MIKKIFLVILSIVSIIIIWNFDMLQYASNQAYGQYKIIWESENINDLILKKNTNKTIKRKLLLVQHVAEFAIHTLHLKPTRNYIKVYLPDKDTVTLAVINASDKLNLKEYLWHYPIIGDAPYKGFFNKKLLQTELKELHPKNLDVDIGIVEAWSTLGWFNDPLMGSMLDKDDEELAATIIHEMLHATLFVKNSSQLNENLAEFVGEEGAKLYFNTSKNVNDSIDYFTAKETKNKRFNLFMHLCAKQLQHLYDSNLSIDEKLMQKKKLLFSFCVELYKKNIFSIEKNRLICARILKSKNAFFTGFLTYNAKDETFKNELNTTFNKNIILFINYYKTKYK